jgi:MFS family permease
MFCTLTTNVTRPIIPLFAADTLGASPFYIGVLVSAYALIPMLLALSIGKWLDRYGARAIATFGGTGMVFSCLIPMLYPSVMSIIVSQLFVGFFNICLLISYQKTVGNRAGDRDNNIMWMTLSFAVSEFLGPIIGGFSFQFLGFQWTLAIAAMFVLFGTFLGLVISKDNWKGGAARNISKKSSFFDSLELLKNTNVRKVLFLSAIILYTKDLFVAYFPVYGNHIGLSASRIGIILSSAAGMAIIIRFSQYWLVHTFGRKNVLFSMLIISGFSFAAIPFFSSVPILFLFSGLIGSGLGLGQPISLVYALNSSSKDRHGEILGLRLTFNKGSQFVAPFLFGAIGGAAGLMPIFLTSGVFLLAGAFGTMIKEENMSDASS